MIVCVCFEGVVCTVVFVEGLVNSQPLLIAGDEIPIASIAALVQYSRGQEEKKQSTKKKKKEKKTT